MICTYNFGFCPICQNTRRPRHRRTDDAPRIETGAWVQAMSRRIEASVSRDRLFGLVTWTYVFRSSVQCSHSLYAYEIKDPKHQEGTCTPQSLEKGAIEIARALWGVGIQMCKANSSVGGYMTKVRSVPGVSSAAQLLLQKTCRTLLANYQAHKKLG